MYQYNKKYALWKIFVNMLETLRRPPVRLEECLDRGHKRREKNKNQRTKKHILIICLYIALCKKAINYRFFNKYIPLVLNPRLR